MEYDNIISLAPKSNYKKIMIMRDSWNNGNTKDGSILCENDKSIRRRYGSYSRIVKVSINIK